MTAQSAVTTPPARRPDWVTASSGTGDDDEAPEAFGEPDDPAAASNSPIWRRQIEHLGILVAERMTQLSDDPRRSASSATRNSNSGNVCAGRK